MSKGKNRNNLTLDLINRVIADEPEAIAELLDYYEPYIISLVKYEEVDTNGYIHKRIDEDMKIQLQDKLVRAIKKWKVIL